MESMTNTTATTPKDPQAQDNQTKPTVACLRCRDQKLKCDRELPSCMRCRKQAATCKYPSPPDRKRIAQQTSRARAMRLNGKNNTDRPESPTAAETKKRQRISDGPKEFYGVSDSQEPCATELPSTEIGLLLLEIYFKRIYNSKLLFHKNIAFQLYRQGDIPDYLLRAIFAQAASFLKQVDDDCSYNRYIKIFPMQTLFEKAWPWARAASQEVLSQADEPTLLRIQTLQVLQFYYFSQDEIQRARVHGSLAYSLSQILGYDKLYEDVASPSMSRMMRFDREMKRRSFWASWCSFCLSSDHLDSSRACERISGLPLPAKFVRGGSVKGVDLEIGDKMEGDRTVINESLPNEGLAVSSPSSLMAEVVKLLGIWTKVQTLICNCTIQPNSQRTSEFNKLVELLDTIKRSVHLPREDICSRAEFYDESPEILVSVCSIYHLCQLLINASMIPMLSSYPAESSPSSESTLKHAEAVIRQATEYTKLLQQFLAKDLDITMLWPFGAYGAFVAGSTFMAFSRMPLSVWSANRFSDIPGPDSEEMKTIQVVLGVSSIYWKPLRGLVLKLNKLINASHSSEAALITPTLCPGSTPCSNQYLKSRLPHSTDTCRTLPGQQVLSHAIETTGSDFSHTPNSQTLSMSLEHPLLNAGEGGVFDSGWWNSISMTDLWGGSLPSVETPSKDFMS